MMNKDTITGLSKGEANRNAIADAKGTPALSIPRRSGMVEQEQKGVRAPKPAPRMLPRILCRPPKALLMVSSDTYSWIRPTRKVMPMNNIMSSAAISRKKFAATAKLFQNICVSFKNAIAFSSALQPA
ncbi:MAG: hypothetical protein BWY13_00081 [Euryarchaeota archaeon ADurb.Bin190]|nr:MAG: hypothetical protein BWY13_00081 [Euryarchaeota archaeon ADurb.Bin190]